jgi:hypothetical protein
LSACLVAAQHSASSAERSTFPACPVEILRVFFRYALGLTWLPRYSLARGFFFSAVLQFFECHLFIGHFRRTGRIGYLLLALADFRADII